MEYRTREEELEYKRYLRKRIRQRKRRRQVMIARTIVAVVALLLVVGIAFLLKTAVGHITGNDNKAEIEAKKDLEEKATQKPLSVNVPNGYEKEYEQLMALREEYPAVDDILLNLYQYPKDILNMAIQNQETISFVAGYPKHQQDTAASGKIKESELENGIPAFQQWDSRWGYVKYGNNIIAVNGCGPTCMSMVYSGLKKDTAMSPAEMAEYCLEKSYYSADSGTAWSMMTTGAEDLGLQAEQISVSKEAVKEALKAGHPVICSMAPGDFTTQGHFIVLTGLSEDGKIQLNDPNSIERTEKEWTFKKVISQVKAAWSYSIS